MRIKEPFIPLTLIVTLTLALGLTLTLLWLLDGKPPVAQAQGPDGYDTYHVAKSCAGVPTPCFTTVQAAVDAADDPDDVVKIASGIYTDINDYDGLAQVVYVSKTITIRGGYTTTNWTTPHSITQPTTLDAQRQGRVLYVTGPDISPTIEGLHITGGDSFGLGGDSWDDVGGGAYIISATIAISNNWMLGNFAMGSGGGIYLRNAVAILHGNVFSGNIASGHGSGLCAEKSDAMISDNVFSNNEYASYSGGGLFLRYNNTASSTISNNIFSGNRAAEGGGLMLDRITATVNGNTFINNTADNGYGGGLHVRESEAIISENVIVFNNTCCDGGGVLVAGGVTSLVENTIISNTAGAGGGLDAINYSDSKAQITITRNIISGNRVESGYGSGGIYMHVSTATLTGNIITRNTANRYSSGVEVRGGNDITLINNLIADNHTISDQQNAYGLYISNSSVRLLHNTIARNTGSGVHIINYYSDRSTVALINTILVSHTVGIYVADGNTVTLEATLWGTDTWANTADWAGAGNITTGTINIWGDPAFLNPDAGNYHITSSSAAIDAGVDAGITTDVDGEPRPAGHSYDIGADELYSPTLKVIKRAYPNPVQAGERLTYTIRVTNTGNVTLTATITDFLPAHITPGETPSGTLILPNTTLTWGPVAILPGNVWAETVVVTVEVGYNGPLTNVVQVTSPEGASGVYTNVATPPPTFGVEFVPDHTGNADPGTVITYIHALTNTGNGPDTFSLEIASSEGWPVALLGGAYPTGTLLLPLSLNAATTTTLQVSLTVPADAISGTLDTTIVTATSQANDTILAVVTDATIVNHAPGIALSPDRSATTNPSSIVTYTHILTNTGNGPDSFDLAHESDQGWAVEYVTPVSVGYNQTTTLIVRVTVPAGSSELTDTTIITATSQADTGTHATVTDATIVNTAPVADAGPDQSVTPGEAVALDGSDSTDSDGHLPLSYHWQQTGGPLVTLFDAGQIQATFQAPSYQSVLTFTLTVTDALGLRSSPDTVVVYVEGDGYHVYLPLVLRQHP